MGNVLSIIAIIISAISLLVSFANVYYFRKQTKIMEKRKFTDEPINAYTVKLDSIGHAIDRLTEQLKEKK